MEEKLQKKGTFSSHKLSRSVLKHIGKRDEALLTRTQIGNDAAIWKDGMCQVTQSAADKRLADSLGLTVSEFAYIKAANNLYVIGAVPKMLEISVIASPEIKEGRYRSEMDSIIALASSENVQITGGHTEVSEFVTEYIVSVTMTGWLSDEEQIRKSSEAEKPCPGDDIILVKRVGDAGAHILSVYKEEELLKRFSRSYILDARIAKEGLSVKDIAFSALSNGAKYVHDISFGGLYGAVSEVAEKINYGVKLGHKVIPINQPVIEICEYFHINPYELFDMGSLILVSDTENSQKIIEALTKAGETATVIGTVTREKEKIVYEKSLDIRRVITSYDGDSIYQVL